MIKPSSSKRSSGIKSKKTSHKIIKGFIVFIISAGIIGIIIPAENNNDINDSVEQDEQIVEVDNVILPQLENSDVTPEAVRYAALRSSGELVDFEINNSDTDREYVELTFDANVVGRSFLLNDVHDILRRFDTNHDTLPNDRIILVFKDTIINEDEYGNRDERFGNIFSYVIETDELRKINFDNVNYSDMPRFAENIWEHPGLD